MRLLNFHKTVSVCHMNPLTFRVDWYNVVRSDETRLQNRSSVNDNIVAYHTAFEHDSENNIKEISEIPFDSTSLFGYDVLTSLPRQLHSSKRCPIFEPFRLFGNFVLARNFSTTFSPLSPYHHQRHIRLFALI